MNSFGSERCCIIVNLVAKRHVASKQQQRAGANVDILTMFGMPRVPKTNPGVSNCNLHVDMGIDDFRFSRDTQNEPRSLFKRAA